MDWEKGEESENVEDRRGMSGKKLAVGGGIGAVVILLIAAVLGVDPQKLNQFMDQAPDGGKDGGNRQVEERPLTPEEKRYRKFAATILRFTEDVWDKQFTNAGKRY